MPKFLQRPIARMALLLCIAAPSLCLANCASGSAPQAPTAPTTSAAWSLTFHQSGGFAGFDRQLDLTSSGVATVVDKRRNLTRRGQASSEELQAISQMVIAVDPDDARLVPGCADCFEYSLDLQRPGSRLTIHANDSGLTPGVSPEPLVRSLNQLLTRLLNAEQA